MTGSATIDTTTYVLRLGVTVLFVALNGFFVAAEFALVKVRATRIEALAEEGHRSAMVVRHILGYLDSYLSACQLGITLSSLILGWLAEPAIAELLLAGVRSAGVELSETSPVVHGVALFIALTIVTGLHMVFGEQAPKIWAIHRAESTALFSAYPLRIFAALFRPLIWVINGASNRILRLLGLAPEHFNAEDVRDVSELRNIVATAARAGYISTRQSQLAQNIFGIMGFEVRHILVPRMDVQYLSLQKSFQENLELIRTSGHSRFPLCEVDLDTVVGIVHTRDLFHRLTDDPSQVVDLKDLARQATFVPETQPISRLIAVMQSARNHVAIAVDEHGSCTGLVFFEDALEEIVGPIHDEFDEPRPTEIEKLEDGSLLLPGGLALPKAIDLLALTDLESDVEAETIAGLVTGRIGRLPKVGDEVPIGRFMARIEAVSLRRIQRLRFTPRGESKPS